MRTLLLLFAVVLAAAPASAQRLSVTPDTLRFDGPAVLSMALRNDTAAPVAFDSLRFERLALGPTFINSWHFYWVAPAPGGGSEGGSFLCGVVRPGRGLPEEAPRRCTTDLDGRVVLPGATVELTVWLDCNACRTDPTVRAGGFDDVAEFFSGGITEPQRVPFLNAVVADAEGGPGAGALAVGPVVPNPSRGAARLDVTLDEPGSVRVEVADALGRIVRREPARGLPTGTHALALDLSALPPGVYVARVVAETSAGVGWTSRRLTLAR